MIYSGGLARGAPQDARAGQLQRAPPRDNDIVNNDNDTTTNNNNNNNNNIKSTNNQHTDNGYIGHTNAIT